MNEADRVEAQAMRDAIVLGGGRAELVGGAMCFSQPALPAPELNRALPIGQTVDVGAIAAWFGDHAHTVAVPPGYLGLEQQLEAHGYEPGHAWMKFDRNDDPAQSVATSLRIEPTLDADAFARTSAEGFGLPVEAARIMSAFVGAPGWTALVAWSGDEPAACGALYADGPWAWLGVAATRPAYRGRGAQSALLAARIDAARAAGATRLVTETGERVEGRPDQSYRNILRAGFREAYLRPNWTAPLRLAEHVHA
jgi:GNAT superfamily N-acetyltransferase